jgi:hypothetical protein
MFYTYSHATPEGRIFYIGKGRGKRAYDLNKRNDYWNRIVKKHGTPTVQVLADWETEEDAFSHEVLLISCFRNMGYELANLTNGGEGQSGMIPWNKGIPWEEEVKLKMSVGRSGSPAWNKGIPLTEDCKKKLSEAMVGRTSWNKGVSSKESTKQKISDLKKGNLNCLQYKIIGTNIETGDVIKFVGAKALNSAGFIHTAVYMCITGKRKSHKGYTWTKELLGSK